GTGLEPPPCGGNRHRRFPGQPFARWPLPNLTPTRRVGAHAGRLLPRRTVRDPRDGGRSLRRRLRARSERQRKERPDRIPQIAVIALPPLEGGAPSPPRGRGREIGPESQSPNPGGAGAPPSSSDVAWV